MKIEKVKLHLSKLKIDKKIKFKAQPANTSPLEQPKLSLWKNPKRNPKFNLKNTEKEFSFYKNNTNPLHKTYKQIDPPN